MLSYNTFIKTPTEVYYDKIEQAFSILGQRWNGLILHALLDGPKRLSQLEEGMLRLESKRRSDKGYCNCEW